MDSHPKYQAGHTKTAKYHDLNMEIKSNHDLANSTNYSLSINGPEQRAVSAPAELPQVKNPSPSVKGNPKP